MELEPGKKRTKGKKELMYKITHFLFSLRPGFLKLVPAACFVLSSAGNQGLSECGRVCSLAKSPFCFFFLGLALEVRALGLRQRDGFLSWDLVI